MAQLHASKATPRATPAPKAILRAWTPFKALIGVTTIRTKADYRHVRNTIDALLDEMGDDENHPLADVLDYLGSQVKTYEDAQVSIPEAAPHEVLQFLMQQQGLKQDELNDCAPQSHVSAILAGKRSISKLVAKRLAKRFHVAADVFL